MKEQSMRMCMCMCVCVCMDECLSLSYALTPSASMHHLHAPPSEQRGERRVRDCRHPPRARLFHAPPQPRREACEPGMVPAYSVCGAKYVH